MAYDLSFAAEFFSNADPFVTDKPYTVEQALHAMTATEWKEMVAELFPGTDPDMIGADTIADMIRTTNTCSNLDSPVTVWIDPKGYHTVDVHEAPRHIPVPGKRDPLCGDHDHGEVCAWMDRNHVANCLTCIEMEPDA